MTRCPTGGSGERLQQRERQPWAQITRSSAPHNDHSGRSGSGHLTVERPIITAALVCHQAHAMFGRSVIAGSDRQMNTRGLERRISRMALG